MPPVWCSGCNKLFSDHQYFTSHIDANPLCLHKWAQKDPPKANGLSRPAVKKRKVIRESSNRRELLQGIEELLKEKVVENDDPFEFVGEDVANPSKPIRVLLKDPKDERNQSKEAADTNYQGKIGLSKEEIPLFLWKHGHLVQRNLDSTEGKSGMRAAKIDCTERKSGTDQTILASDVQSCDDDDPSCDDGSFGSASAQIPQAPVQFKPMEDFNEYIQSSKQNYRRHSPEMKAAIELMNLMNEKGGSVALYDAVFQWHMEHLHTKGVIDSAKLHSTLVKRYNLQPTMPSELKLELPHSKEVVNLASHDATAMTVDLLTDPRLQEKDYLFNQGNPEAGPEEEFEVIGDVNTGMAYRETYRKLIQPNPYTECGRRRVLLPYIYYIDGCVTGNYGNLSIEILKFTIGLFNGDCRNKDWAWRNLGYVKKLLKRSNQAQKNIKKSKHKDAKNYVTDQSTRGRIAAQLDAAEADMDWERYASTNQPDPGHDRKKAPEIKSQDFHAMLQAILQSYSTLEESGGLAWDLPYSGKLHKLVFVPFIIFVKADSVEADKVSGCYNSKSGNVKCLCRYCCIPSEVTDQPYIEPEPTRKTQPMIEALVRNGDDESKEALKNMSQHELWNAFYRHRFGLHNSSGIHGATPWEALHWIQLGWYKYDREAFFLQTGTTSNLSASLDALCETFGQFLDRQSDRSLPRVSFTDGIREGKMQAHEMTGVILLITITLRSQAGRNLILNTARGEQKEFFPDEGAICNWIEMLESHLMFEKWLEKDEIKVSNLERAKTKIKELMSLTKHVGKRTKGMGYNTSNFHAAFHMAELALFLCVFKWFNTAFNESHHKKDKKTASRTNKQSDTFDISHAQKVVHRTAVELAIHEIDGCRKWDYYRKLSNSKQEPTTEHFHPFLQGATMTFSLEDDILCSKLDSRMDKLSKEKYVHDPNTTQFIKLLCRDLMNDNQIKSVVTRGTLTVYSLTADGNRQHYHAMPYSLNRAWHDWAMFDLSEPESPTVNNRVPAQIKCFLDFQHLPEENGTAREPGIYAIVEPVKRNIDPDEMSWSQLWDPWFKEPCTVPGYHEHNHQVLVNVNKILRPAIFVPDHEHNNERAFLGLTSPSDWGNMFDDWLELEHLRRFE